MIPSFNTAIRGLNINGERLLDDETQLVFTSCGNHFLIAQEIFSNSGKNIPATLKQFFEEPVIDAKKALENGAEVISYKLNVDRVENLGKFVDTQSEIIEEIMTKTGFPLILSTLSTLDSKNELICEIAKNVNKPIIFAGIAEDNFKQIIPVLLNTAHLAIARTPIDINLTKELNILIRDMGFPLDRLIIDPTAAALGYGMDYAYSIIERIKFAALNGDTTLNLPIISMCAEEVWRAKETKSADYPDSWGNLEDRALMWELTTASAFISAGANIIVVAHPQSVKYFKKIFKEQ